MKKQLFLYFSAFFLIFVSCEEIPVEPEFQEAQSKANVQKALNFRAHLSGDQEVPAVETKATGQAIFKLSKDGTQLYYKVLVANIENVLMAHIHIAPSGENGPVAVWLYPSGPPPMLIPGRTDGILTQGIITEDDLVGELAGTDLENLIELMVSGKTYVNVHTSLFRGGEIRGQIEVNVGP